MTDQELLKHFDSSRLPQEHWTHRAHLRVALLYLRRLGAARALEQLRDRIQRLNLFHGVYTTPDGGYHETRTRVWLSVLNAAADGREDWELIEHYSQLDICLDYYERSTLRSWESRIGWVEPDKKMLPVDPGPWCPSTPELFTFPQSKVMTSVYEKATQSFSDCEQAIMNAPLGDLSPEQFSQSANYLVDWLSEYLGPDSRPEPVLSQVKPGEMAATQSQKPPLQGQDSLVVLQEFREKLSAGLTHWNCPRFFAYFSISASAPGVLADFLSSGLNQQAMLWRTSPVATELEGVTLSWLRQALGLPSQFDGVIYDTASVSTLHAIATARDVTLPDVRMRGQAGRQLVVYCSEHTHSSIDKAVLMLGLGWDNLRKIPCDENLAMIPEELETQIQKDREAGLYPCCVVATTGTTSTAAVDPVDKVADICEREKVWLHVDAAYGGAMAILEESRGIFRGWERADSIVFNPHKWLFTPFDCSVLYTRKLDKLKQAFSLTPEYLRNAEEGQVMNLMDTGVQLGRRFRSLKLWMLFRCFGLEGLRERVKLHLDLAQELGRWVEESDDFELSLPVSMSLVCFRWARHTDDEQLQLMEKLNQGGKFFISHTKVKDQMVLRCAIGHIRTNVDDIKLFFEEITRLCGQLSAV